MTNTTYNGWKNRATWNITLWLENYYGYYSELCNYARQFAEGTGKDKRKCTYRNFIVWAGLKGMRTPDRFSFSGRDLDIAALNEFVREHIDH